jgi:hypothetical protein
MFELEMINRLRSRIYFGLNEITNIGYQLSSA